MEENVTHIEYHTMIYSVIHQVLAKIELPIFAFDDLFLRWFMSISLSNKININSVPQWI